MKESSCMYVHKSVYLMCKLKHYFPNPCAIIIASQERAAEMTSNVMQGFRERIASRSWLDEQTRQRAIRKVGSISTAYVILECSNIVASHYGNVLCVMHPSNHIGWLDGINDRIPWHGVQWQLAEYIVRWGKFKLVTYTVDCLCLQTLHVVCNQHTWIFCKSKDKLMKRSKYLIDTGTPAYLWKQYACYCSQYSNCCFL